MTRTDAQMKIRLPDSLKSQIEKAAQVGGRSLNAEIIRRLEESFKNIAIDPVEYAHMKIYQPDFLMEKIDTLVKESVDKRIREELNKAGVKSLFDEHDE